MVWSGSARRNASSKTAHALPEADYRETAVSRLRPGPDDRVWWPVSDFCRWHFPPATELKCSDRWRVVIGGLVTATLLTSLVVPAIYPWFAAGLSLDESPEDAEVEAAFHE
jgi:hypothetical protein